MRTLTVVTWFCSEFFDFLLALSFPASLSSRAACFFVRSCACLRLCSCAGCARLCSCAKGGGGVAERERERERGRARRRGGGGFVVCVCVCVCGGGGGLFVIYINKVRMFVCHLCKYEFCFEFNRKKIGASLQTVISFVTRKEKVVLQ